MRKIFIALIAILCLQSFSATSVHASPKQDTSGILIPINLQLWHDKISEEQTKALNMDGKVDQEVTVSDDPAVNLQVTQALIGKVNKMRSEIETSALDHRHKVLYLSGLYSMLRAFNMEHRYGRIDATLAPLLVQNFSQMLSADREGKSIASLLHEIPYSIGTINISVFNQNHGYQAARMILLRQYAKEHPQNFLYTLSTYYPDLIHETFVDSVIVHIAHQYPEEVYNYATSYKPVGDVIRKNQDPLVQAIVKIGSIPQNAVRLLPFVDYVVKGTYTVPQLRKMATNDAAFYSLSVKTLIDLNKKILEGDHPVGQKAMESNVKKLALTYVRQVNELHESPDAVRFACANNLTPQEIYYILVNSQEEIYTSSFVGLFKRLMQRMDPPRGDKLLMSIVFDRFRKFITLSAAYNTLDPFLNSMNLQNANLLMRKFVGGLQYTKGLEDAVDVADAFGSIKDSVLLKNLQDEVNQNFQQMVQEKDERGKVIYGLLASLFNTRQSSDEDAVWSREMSQKLNLPPIDYIPFKQLVNDSSGRIYQEVFFYGDKDGFMSYNSFMTSFHNGDWQINNGNKYFTIITSLKGKPVTIYAKKPISDPDEDEKSMRELQAYLEKNNIQPTVFIHRGHSYHVNATIAELQSSAKLVMLGSCGGYNSLAGVLNVAPDAQIITSKQTGSMWVNEPIIRVIEKNIREGKDLRWETIWSNLSNEFKKDPAHYDLFQDYIPPQKNMGAIFIKAYKRLMNAQAPVDTSE
jgi:hypothetical protein